MDPQHWFLINAGKPYEEGIHKGKWRKAEKGI
jgi:hypothetical protein